VSRADFGVISVHSLFSFQNKDDHSKKKTMTTSFHASVGMWSPPYKTAREFLGISGKIYTLKNAKGSFWSAPWGAKYKKSDKKATCPSQEIRKKSGQIWFFCKRIYFLCPFDPEKTKHMTYTSPINHLYNLWLDIYIYILFQTLAS